MNFIRFILHSYIFRKITVATIGFIITLFLINYAFDKIWRYTGFVPVINLNEFYQIPKQYDNTARINIKLLQREKIAIECNKRFRVSKKTYDYYDTLKIESPDSVNPMTNKIFIRYEKSPDIDSVYLVLSKSDKPDIYWNQIFYSSVIVSRLNHFSNDPDVFRIHDEILVSDRLLKNNDTLINEAINYFNENSRNLGLAECGTNSNIFYSICSKYQLPCRVVPLQGGDGLNQGFDNKLGYPLHVICEVYSSKNRKWMIIDPTYGSTYLLDTVPMNAVEISNRFFFMNAMGIKQDSVMVTRKTILGKDYFKFYENIYFPVNSDLNYFVKKILNIFYKNFLYEASIYSNNLNIFQNGLTYVAIKSVALVILSSIYFYVIFAFTSRRLLHAKWKKP